MIISDLNILETVTAGNVMGGCCVSRYECDDKYYDDKDKKNDKGKKGKNDKKYDNDKGEFDGIDLTITQDVIVIQEISFN